MHSFEQQIAENLAEVRGRIAEAAQQSGRPADAVTLVAVTKYVGVEETAAVLAAGCRALGESRPQQLWEKAAANELAGSQWHLIGHLQRNKVQRTIPLTQLIHSVDSERLLRTIDDAAAEQQLRSRVLLEVNCSGDAEKHGLTADELRRLLTTLLDYPHVEVCGLMTMAAREGDLDVAEQNFDALRGLRDAVAAECPDGVRLTELSMGMSHDYEVAIRAGATIVRVGSALFRGIVP